MACDRHFADFGRLGRRRGRAAAAAALLAVPAVSLGVEASDTCRTFDDLGERKAMARTSGIGDEQDGCAVPGAREPAFGARRIAVRISEDVGGAVFEPGAHIRQHGLTGKESWRRDVGVEAELVRGSQIGLSMHGRHLDSRMPKPGYFGGLAIGGYDGWQDSTATDLGALLDIAGGRIRYGGGVSRFRARTAASVPFASVRAGPPQVGRAALDVKHGRRLWQRIDANLPDGGDVQASLFGLYGFSDAGYEAPTARNASAPATPQNAFSPDSLSPGTTLRFGSRVAAADAALTLGYDALAEAERDTRTLTATAEYGAVAAAFRQVSQITFAEAEPDVWTAREQSWGGDVTVSLAAIAREGDPSAAKLLPNSIVLSGAQKAVRSATTADDPGDLETRYGLTMAWRRENGSTEARATRIRLDGRAAGSEADDSDGLEIGIRHALKHGSWDLTFAAALSKVDGREGGSRKDGQTAKAEATVGYRADGAPHLVAGPSFGRKDTWLGDTNDPDTEHALGLTLEADFAEFLAAADADQPPYLKLRYRGEWRQSDTDPDADAGLGHTVGLTFGMQF